MSFHGSEKLLRTCSGAVVIRVVHAPGQEIRAHRHDWACLTLPVIGSYAETHEDGSIVVEGPSVVMHPPGASHSDVIGARGLETISMQLDPAWLPARRFQGELDRSRIWLGGRVAALGRVLAGIWQDPGLSERDLCRATAAFLLGAIHSPPEPRPDWIGQAAAALGEGEPPSTRVLARQLRLNPAWLTRAYRAHAGEGVQETVRRKRVEAAVSIMRNSSANLADIAAEAGFCDQSHMNRSFQALLRRTPAQVRSELRSSSPTADGPA